MAKILNLLRSAFLLLRRNDPLRLAAATAFFSTFALPAILIILIQTLGMVFPRRVVGRNMLQHLAGIIGTGTVNDLRVTLRNVRHLATTWYFAAGGFLFLIFVSTTLFAVIKDSLNQVWNVEVKPKPGFMIVMKQRAQSFAIILLAGLLFMLVLLAESAQALLGKYFTELFGSGPVSPQYVISQVISLIVVSMWFTVVFRFLPDGKPHWKVAITGGLFTGVLFTGGKLLLGFLLSYSNMQTIYGASTYMALLLLFVFYSAFMFYYGACFTKEWADAVKRPISCTKSEVGGLRSES